MACVLPVRADDLQLQDSRRAGAALTQDWSAWGGAVGIRWNHALLKDYGMTVGRPDARIQSPDHRPHDWFELRQGGGLTFRVANGALRHFTGGQLQSRGGYQLMLDGQGSIDLRNFTLRVRAKDPMILDVVGADGKVWFYIDHLMFELVRQQTQVAIKAADVRIAPALAERIGHPEIADYAVADFAVESDVFVQGVGAAPDRACAPYPWPGVDVPGVPGQKYQADLFMLSITPQYMRCAGCDATSTNGKVMFAPSSQLKNNVNDGSIQQTVADPLGKSSALYTANVVWNTMFSGNTAPYNNDQHPFLIWNVYRIDAQGRLSQIGRSGVKHAWLTTNGGCLDACYNSHSLGRGCSDTYSTDNNDTSYDMGPRSEIVPAKGLWGRCGSLWDPSCSGDGDHFTNGASQWDNRLLISESQMGARFPGATYLFESWYIARDDINIYNSMATVNINPRKTGSAWTVSGASGYKLGSAIDRWIGGVLGDANARITELAVAEGHAKVAVKVSDAGHGRWRYDYAVMNFDFAREVTTGAEPGHLRVLSNRGFDSFSVPLPAGVRVLGPAADLGDANPNVRWRVSTQGNRVTWSNQAGSGIGDGSSPPSGPLPTLDWGVLYSFSFTTSAPPADGSVSLHVAQAGTPASYEVATLVPSAPADGVGVDR